MHNVINRISPSAIVCQLVSLRFTSLIFLTGITLSSLVGCGNADSAAKPAEMAMPVTVLDVQREMVPILVEAVGQTEGSKEVEVRARVSGILTKQHYHEGDRVTAGTTLFTIDPIPYEIALAQARAALAQDQANLERSTREATRLKPLVEQRAISQKEYDDATSSLKTSEASSAVSQAKVREAELNLQYTNVTATISGVTGRAQQSVGSLVSAGTANSLLTTIDITNPIWLRFSLSESETLQLRKLSSNKAKVKLILADGSTYAAEGTLNFAGSSVDAQTGTVPLRASFPNPKLDLLPGQFARVQVTIGERDGFIVPQSALFQNDQGKVVFTVSAENKVAPRPVQADGWSGTNWVVTQGLNNGDKLIIDNLMKLRPGAAVAPHPPGQGPGAPPPAKADATKASEASGTTANKPADSTTATKQ